MKSTRYSFGRTVALGVLVLFGGGAPALAAPILSAGDAALTGATLETFNSAPTGSFASQTVNGITVSSATTFGFNTGANGTYAPPNPTGDIYILAQNSLLTFTFGSGVSAFGIVIGATNLAQTMSAYDAADNLLETLAIPNQVATLPSPYAGFYGLSSGSANIAYFTVTNVSDGVVYDDLLYAAAAIPEPGMLALFGLGLAGLGIARRRRAA